MTDGYLPTEGDVLNVTPANKVSAHRPVGDFAFYGRLSYAYDEAATGDVLHALEHGDVYGRSLTTSPRRHPGLEPVIALELFAVAQQYKFPLSRDRRWSESLGYDLGHSRKDT